MSTFNTGDSVLFLAAGKVSRLDNVAGKWMPGTVQHVDWHGVHIEKDYPSIVPDALADAVNVKHC